MNPLLVVVGIVSCSAGFAGGWYLGSRDWRRDWRARLPNLELQMREAYFRDLDKATKDLEGQDVLVLVNRFGYKWRRFMLEAYKVDRRLVAARNEFHLLMAEWEEKLERVLSEIDRLRKCSRRAVAP